MSYNGYTNWETWEFNNWCGDRIEETIEDRKPRIYKK